MTRATFYNHFESREAFFEQVAFEITHHFNEVILPFIDQEQDAPRRIAKGTKYYLTKAIADPSWGWAVVNMSLNSPKLFGEETFNQVTTTLAKGLTDESIKLRDLDAGRDMFLGAILAALLHILHGNPVDNYVADMTVVVLRGLGVSCAKAERIAYEPLPPIPDSSAPFRVTLRTASGAESSEAKNSARRKLSEF